MKKHKRKELGLSALSLLGAVFSLATVIAVAFALAIFSAFTKDPTSWTGALSLAALFIGGAVSAFVTSRVNGEAGTLIGILSSVTASAIILIIGLILKKGLLPFGPVINAVAFLAISVIFSILGKKRMKSTHKRRYA